MEIRYIAPEDDRNTISRIYEKSWRYAYRGIVPQDYLDSIPEGQWSKNPDIPGWSTLLCIEDGQPVGTSSFCHSRWPEYPNQGEIISIYFLPEYTGRGFGRQLLYKAIDELRKLGYTEVFLWVLEDNVSARRFYERCGFINSGDKMTGTVGGKDLVELRYIYKIS